MSTPTKVYDLYASILNFKESITTLNAPFVTLGWVPLSHQRRLQAYEILSAYYCNYSRDYRQSPESGDTSYNDLIAEMGDSAWLCDKLRTKLLGDTVSISIPGPKSLKVLRRLRKNPAGREAELAELEKIEAARLAMEDHIQDWWDENDIYLTVNKNETKCSYLGDCVYAVGWNAEEARPTLETYDPGFVFPEWDLDAAASMDESASDKVSRRVIIAWEDAHEATDQSYNIWRDIYELRTVAGKKKCFRHYGWYEWQASSDRKVYDMNDDDIIEGTSTGWHEIGLDFIPIVWVPNIECEGEDYGKSNINDFISLFDSIITNYTDLKFNSEKLGGAIIALSGKNIKFAVDSSTREPIGVEVKPNTIYNLGENGKMDLLNTAELQTALLSTIEKLEKKLIRNSCITEVGAGLADTQQELAGIALKMLLLPLIERIGPVRQQRQSRYAQVFWMVMRYWQIFGTPEERKIFAGPLYNVQMNFGSLLPGDRKAQIEEYAQMANLFGLETTLEIARDDGYDLDIDAIMEAKENERQQRIEETQAQFQLMREEDSTGVTE
ncbi:MAG: phage portal protein [bacterium]